jgi:hypothetical protein
MLFYLDNLHQSFSIVFDEICSGIRFDNIPEDIFIGYVIQEVSVPAI